GLKTVSRYISCPFYLLFVNTPNIRTINALFSRGYSIYYRPKLRQLLIAKFSQFSKHMHRHILFIKLIEVLPNVALDTYWFAIFYYMVAFINPLLYLFFSHNYLN